MSGVSVAAKRLVPRSARHRVYPLRHALTSSPGTPPGLTSDVLDDVVRDLFGIRTGIVRHAPMPGYKFGGVYRVWVTSKRGRTKTLVFKRVSLLPEDYPAIASYPGTPGIPEWELLHEAYPQVSAVVPVVYRASRAEDEKYHQFLMEDLSWTHRPVLTESDVETVVSRLPAVHSALGDWSHAVGYQHRIDWSPASAGALLGWVEESLNMFLPFDSSGMAEETLRIWGRVIDAFTQVEAAASAPCRIVHGDFNRMNTFLEVDGSGIRAVDWEWMGWGPPHIDLASVLKRSPWSQQRALVRRFFDDDDVSHEHNWQVFLWSRLGRCLLDAALHARQNASGIGHTAYDVGAHLRRAREVMDVLDTTQTLSRSLPSPTPEQDPHPRVPTEKPQLTIALPVYNGARYLRETLESILSQTFTDFELIISDNASTDATPQILEEFAGRDDRIRVVRRTETVGAHFNYNDVLSLARGEYFKWAADDDLYEPEFLELCVKELDQHPEAVLAYTQTVDIDSQDAFIVDRPLNLDLSDGAPSQRFSTYLAAPNACLPIFGVHRKSALAATDLLGHYAGGDGVLLAELTLHGTFREVPHPLFRHREHEGRSVNTLPHPRWRAQWFHPGRQGPDPYHWKALLRYVRGVARAPIGWSDRIRASSLLFRWSVSRAPKLMRDLVAVVGWRLTSGRSRRSQGSE